MKRVPLLGEDCGGIPALALRKFTNEKNTAAIEELAKQTAVFDTQSKSKLTMASDVTAINILSDIDDIDNPS